MNHIEEVKTQTYTFIASAATLVVGLTWKDTFKIIIEKLVPNGEKSISFNIFYALLLTFILVIFLNFIKKYLAEDVEDEKPEQFKT